MTDETPKKPLAPMPVAFDRMSSSASHCGTCGAALRTNGPHLMPCQHCTTRQMPALPDDAKGKP